LERERYFFRQRAEAHELLNGEGLLEETTDRDARPLGGRRRKNGFDTRAVGEAAFEDWPELVDVLADELGGVAERRDEGLTRLELRAG
jgi:hypothetical protein